MVKLEDAVEKVVKKIIDDKESLNLLRTNEFLRDEIRFLTRQIDRLESKVTQNQMALSKKYPESNEFAFFWFWNPIEEAFLINRKPERKKLIEYFEKFIAVKQEIVHD